MSAPVEFRNETPEGSLEIRSFDTGFTETRADGDAPTISGLASVYNQRTTLGHFFQWDEEVIPGAWSRSITRDGADIFSMFNHDPNRLLGRTSAGTLRLTDEPGGLKYEVNVNPDDSNAMSVFSQVERQDVSGASVWFRVIGETWTEPTEDNGLERPLRQITEAELFEAGPVVMPAFPQTTATAARSLDAVLHNAGIDKRRASLTAELLTAPPSEIEQRISEIFARHPEVRDQVCNVEQPAAAAPDDPAQPPLEAVESLGGPPSPHLLDVRNRQLLLKEKIIYV